MGPDASTSILLSFINSISDDKKIHELRKSGIIKCYKLKGWKRFNKLESLQPECKIICTHTGVEEQGCRGREKW